MTYGNETQITPPRVSLVDERTGAVSREWYRWFYSLYTFTGSGTGILPVTSGGTGLGTIPTNGQLLIGNGAGYTLNTLGAGAGISVTNGAGTATVANTGVLSWSGGTTGLTPATATTGAVTLAGTLAIANGGTNGAAAPTAGAVAYGTGTAYGFTAAGTSGYFLKSQGAGIPIWSNSIGGYIVDGTTPYLDWGNGSAVTLAAGRMWYDGSTGAWNLGMGNGNITQQVGEEIFVYGKASAAITDSPLQIIYCTGVVGASGVIKFAPTIVGLTDANAIIGIATESLALNGFGRVTSFGVVRGITTNGAAFGETWADDDVIWYNPVTGNPTKVEPVAPYIKVQVGLVIKAGAGGSGSFQVGVVRGSKLGGTDSNVQFGTLANNDLIAYDTALGYWKNIPSTTFGTGTVTTVGFTGGLITVATATTTPALTVAGTSGGIVYFSSASTWASSAALTQYGVVYGGGAGASPVATAAGTTGQVLTATTGGAPTWANPATSGTVTSVSVVSANGFAGTVATATTTPAITLSTTITGLLKGNGTAISAAVANTDYVPLSTVITKTADYTITGTDTWIINNKTGSALTLTFPAASSWTGRYITVKNMQAQAVNSASSNIVPIDSTSAGTAILLGVVGNWATMVSDGTNWIIMQAASNNNLLLE